MKKRVVRFLGIFLLTICTAVTGTGCGEKEAEETISDKQITVSPDYVAEENPSGELGALMKTSELFEVAYEEQFSLKAPTVDINGAQGGCIVGDYGYQAFYRKDGGSDQANNHCIILKFDMKTGEVVKQSEILQLNHVNDITYNSKLNCLVVVHNAPFANLLSYIDLDTLERIDTFTIDEFIYSIAYDAKRAQYVVGLSGGQTFKILDENFQAVTDAFSPSDLSSGFTTQGASCDDDYIYFVLYNPNTIMVYDWEGNFVSKLDIDLNVEDWEVENLTVDHGTIYFMGARLGLQTAHIYKVTGLTEKAAVTEEAE